jgi:hypothetical protein
MSLVAKISGLVSHTRLRGRHSSPQDISAQSRALSGHIYLAAPPRNMFQSASQRLISRSSIMTKVMNSLPCIGLKGWKLTGENLRTNCAIQIRCSANDSLIHNISSSWFLSGFVLLTSDQCTHAFPSKTGKDRTPFLCCYPPAISRAGIA